MRTPLIAAALIAASFACLEEGMALSPPREPDCTSSGARFMSTTSLAAAVASAPTTFDPSCERMALGRRPDAMPAWIAMLASPQADIRALAIERLVRGPDFDEARAPTPALADAGFPDSAVRQFIERAAAVGYHACGGGAGYTNDAGADALPLLRKLRTSKDDAVRRAAARCMAELDGVADTTSVWTPVAPSTTLQAMSPVRLTQLATSGKKRDTHPAEAMAAMEELEQRGEDGALALVKVAIFWNLRFKASALQPEASLRERALSALAAMGDDAAPAFAHLARQLNDPALGKLLATPSGPYYLPLMGVRSRAAQEQLLEQTVNNRNAAGRWYAGTVLADMGPIAPDLLPALRRALARKNHRDFGAGAPAQLLAAAGMGAAEGAPLSAARMEELLSIFQAAPGCTGLHGPQACQQIAAQGQAGIRAVMPLLRHRDPAVRRAASDLLGSLGPTARHSASQMAPLLRDEAPLVRRAAAENIARVTHYDISMPDLVLYLLKAASSADQEERLLAAAQLRQFPRLPEASIGPLRKALRVAEGQVHQDYLLEAIAATGSDEAVETLVEHLTSARSQWQRASATAALRGMGPATLGVLMAGSGKAHAPDVMIALASVLAERAHGPAQLRAAAIADGLLPALGAVMSVPHNADPARAGKRREAARRIGALAAFSPKARVLVAQGMDDADLRVRSIMLAAMARTEPKDAMPLLRRQAADARNPVQAQARDALQRLRTRRCVGQQTAVAAVVARCNGI